MTFTLTVAFRASIRTQIPFLIKIIRKALENNIKLALWFCEIFSSQQIIKEFFVDCTIPDMARFTAGLLHTAMINVYSHEKELFEQYIEMVDRGNLIEQLVSLPGDNLISHTEQSGLSNRVEDMSNQAASSMTPGGPTQGNPANLG